MSGRAMEPGATPSQGHNLPPWQYYLYNYPPQQLNLPPPIHNFFSNDLNSQPHYPPRPRSNMMQSPAYSTPYPNYTQTPPLYKPQYPPQQTPSNQYPPTPITPSTALPFSQLPPASKTSISPLAPLQSNLKALPQSQALESALNDADLESLKALLRASGNLYSHMRTTTLRFLLGDKYVEGEEEGEKECSIEGVGVNQEKDKGHARVNSSRSESVNKGKGKGKIQNVAGKGLVIDLVSDDEDDSQQRGHVSEMEIMSAQKKDNLFLKGILPEESDSGTERRLARLLEEERQKTQDIIAKAWETEKQKNEVELAFKEETSRRIKAELALSSETRRREIAEESLGAESKRVETSQSLFVAEQKKRLSQEKLWMEDQRLIEHYRNILAQREAVDVKPLASAAQQYINVVEAGCDSRMLEVAKAGTTSKIWTKMYGKIFEFDIETPEANKQPVSLENRNSLEESLMVEKKKRAAVLEELEAAKAEVTRVTKNYESEWRQVESLQAQIKEILAKAPNPQSALPELKPRNYILEHDPDIEKRRIRLLETQLSNERGEVKYIERQLSNERKERTKVTKLLEEERRVRSNIVAPGGALNKIKDLEKALSDERKEVTRVTALLEKERRARSENIANKRDSEMRGLEMQLSDAMTDRARVKELLEIERRVRSNGAASSSAIESFEKALKTETARSEWFKKQFADQQNKYTQIERRASSLLSARDDIARELTREINRREAVEKALEVEKKLREITERTLTHERDLAGKGEGVPQAQRVLAETKEDALNRSTRNQWPEILPPAKKRKINPTLEELGLERTVIKFGGGRCEQCNKNIRMQDADGPCRYHPGSKTLTSYALPLLVQMHGQRCYERKSVDDMESLYGKSEPLNWWTWNCCRRRPGEVGCTKVNTHAQTCRRQLPKYAPLVPVEAVGAAGRAGHAGNMVNR